MVVEKILYTDNLRNGTDKINAGIDLSNASKAESALAKTTADNAVIIANTADGKSDSTQLQLDNIVINSGTSDAETIQARDTFPLLKDRLNSTDQKLAETDEQVLEAQTDLLNRRVGFETHPSLIRSHFGSLLGQWYLEGEGAGERPLTLTAQASSGATVLTVGSFSGVLNGQLMVYKGVSGEYYTAKVRATTATTITFWTKIEETVLVGTNVWAFYNNSSHPNLYGYRAMADFALKQLNSGGLSEVEIVKSYQNLYVNRTTFFDVIGTPTLTTSAVVGANTPGGSMFNTLQIGPTASGDGVATKPIALDGRVYKYKILANLGSGTAAQTEIRVKTSGGRTIATKLVKAENSTTRILEGYFKPRYNETVWIEAIQTGTTSFFQIGYIDIIRVSNLKTDLNNGKHVLLGDSWFAIPGIFERLQEKLPNATIINKGVGGNKSIDLLGRFDSDVTPNKPDYVWVMVGTNDYVADVTPDVFTTYLDMIITKILEIGAKPIIFESSVGAYVYAGKVDGSLSDLSRNYVFYSQPMFIKNNLT